MDAEQQLKICFEDGLKKWGEILDRQLLEMLLDVANRDIKKGLINTMNNMTEKELLSIIDRYGYDVKEDYKCIMCVKRNSNKIIAEHTHAFGGGDRYNQLKHAAAWIMECEKD